MLLSSRNYRWLERVDIPKNVAKVPKNIQVLGMIDNPKEPFSGNGWEVPENSRLLEMNEGPKESIPRKFGF